MRGAARALEGEERLEERYEKGVMEQLAKLQLNARGDKGKRAEIMKNKILEDNLLFEEEEEGEEDDEEEEMVVESEMDEYGDESGVEEFMRGPNGEIYASSSSGEDEVYEEDGRRHPKRFYIPRCKQQAYKMAEGQILKVKKSNPQKFTAGTDPKAKDGGLINFLVDETIGCPYFLPL